MKLAFGMYDGKLLPVEEAEGGAGCGCTCPGCGAALIAKKGRLKRPHFAHANGAQCVAGAETVAHLLGKELLANQAELCLPGFGLTMKQRMLLRLHDQPEAGAQLAPSRFPIDHVDLERRCGDMVPDVVVYDGQGNTLIIEVRVTHAVDAAKREKLAALGIPALELDLASFHREPITPALLAQQLSRGLRWLAHPRLRRVLHGLAVATEAEARYSQAERGAKEELARRKHLAMAAAMVVGEDWRLRLPRSGGWCAKVVGMSDGYTVDLRTCERLGDTFLLHGPGLYQLSNAVLDGAPGARPWSGWAYVGEDRRAELLTLAQVKRRFSQKP